jgi:cytoskeletal protein RodZ
MKMAIALVAASVFIIAPVLAQNSTLSGGGSSKNPPTTSAPSGENADKEKTDKTEKTEKLEKTEKSTESTEPSEKATSRHHRVARHPRHVTTKTAKKVSKSHTSMAMYRKRHGTRTTKEVRGYAKYESRHTPHGHTHVYGRSSTKRKPSVD